MKKTLLFVIMMLFASISYATHWEPVSYGTSSQTATIIGVIAFEGVEQMSDQLEVGVFYGEVCRGAVIASYVPSLERCYVFLTVYGNSGEEDIFRIYDHATQTELDMTCTQTYVYHDDDNIGSIAEPFVLDFVYDCFEVTVSADPSTAGTVTGAGIYNPDATVILTATANYSYTFTGWTKDGESVSSVTPYSFTASMNTAGDYVAHFKLNTYEITAIANPQEGGLVSGTGAYIHGQDVTLTVIPNVDFEFVNWTEKGEVVSEEMTYSFVAIDDRELVANLRNTTATNENSEALVGLYPNPAAGRLSVKSGFVVNSVEIYTLSGILVLTKDIGSERFEIPVEALPSGTYFLRLMSEQVCEVRKFVKK